MSMASNEAGADDTQILRIRNLTKSYGTLKVLDNIDLDVAYGEVVSVIGPSGSGKSSLLRCINFLTHPDSGSVTFEGRTVLSHQSAARSRVSNPTSISERELRRSMGMVFQSFELFPHLTVLENVTLGQIRVAKRSPKEAKERAIALLEQVGIGQKADEYPGRCSGGQQQRAAIARALALDPKVMLFDEPTSALDPEYGADVLKVMRRLADDGMTMIVVTHEMGFAREVCDRVVVMSDGRVIESGEPHIVFSSPTQERTRRFLAAVLER